MTKAPNINLNPSKILKPTAKDLILESLLLGEHLTHADGPRFGTTHVTQRVSDLRLKDGWFDYIKCRTITLASGKRVTQYYMYEDFKEN